MPGVDEREAPPPASQCAVRDADKAVPAAGVTRRRASFEPTASRSVAVDDAVYRKVLMMVSDLHRRGYQRLRIAPGLSPGGEHWRCSITPITNISNKHGARLVDWEHLSAHYTSGAGAKYFDWSYAANLDPAKLALRFIEEFPLIVEAGRGSDWGYAGWYQEMLGLTHPDYLPIAYRDEGCPKDRLLAIGNKGEIIDIPLPPPGDCVEPPAEL